MSAWAWIVVGFVLLAMEAMHGAFILSMIGLAALATAVVAALTGGSLVFALPAFVVFSLATLFLLRPFAVRRLHRWPGNANTNVSALMGQSARVVQPFAGEDRVGYILIGGEKWRAKLAEGWEIDQLPTGSNCTVLRIDGATLEVCPEELAAHASR